jgi:hypothetical protein
MGGQFEESGYNFFKDSDALFIEILSINPSKSKFSLWKKFGRVGFILAFACVDYNGRPILGLNTVEIAKSWPDNTKAEFYNASMKWLIEFAKKAGFKAIMIGSGYGSGYFRKKYGSQEVAFRKMNPYKFEESYYTNTFEHGQRIEHPEGIILQYEGSGVIIWEE